MSKKVVVSVLIVLGGAVYAYLGGTFSTPEYWEMERTADATHDSLAALRHEVDSLSRYRDSLIHNPAVLERYARERYGMLRPGELSFKMVQDSVRLDSIRP